jgi:hypothetical protein
MSVKSTTHEVATAITKDDGIGMFFLHFRKDEHENVETAITATTTAITTAITITGKDGTMNYIMKYNIKQR